MSRSGISIDAFPKNRHRLNAFGTPERRTPQFLLFFYSIRFMMFEVLFTALNGGYMAMTDLFAHGNRVRLLVILVAVPIFSVMPSQGSALPQNNGHSSPQAPKATSEKKLVLKDGGFRTVREYRLSGNHVHYYSIDRSRWEDISATLVDWEKTKKIERGKAERDKNAAAKTAAEKTEKKEMRQGARSTGIDASFEIAPGVVLPPGEGLFLRTGTTVLKLTPAKIDPGFNKRPLIPNKLRPPILPTSHTVSINGARAELRLATGRLEFYTRVAPNNREPDMKLVFAKVRKKIRDIETTKETVGLKWSARKELPMEFAQIAAGLRRYTLGQELGPGEYAILEIAADEDVSFRIWDFAVDQGGVPAQKKK